MDLNPCLKGGKSSLAHLTFEKLKELLPSYGVKAEDADKVIKALQEGKKFQEPNLTYNTVPQIIGAVMGEEEKKNAVNYVKDQNAKLAPDVPPSTGKTLYRTDTRSKDEIQKDKGLHGRGGSMSVEHARSWAENWNKKSKSEKGTWLQNWKVQTSPKYEEMPYVATGRESQKAGNEYAFEVPKEIGEKMPLVTPEIVFNGAKLDEATVIAVAGREEIVFLTGIPTKYIK